MILKQAIELLKYYQKWRRGADVVRPSPRQIGEAIDVILEHLKNKE